MIAHISARTNTGCPYATTNTLTVERDQVAALGKLTAWGSSVVSFVLKLRDDRIVMIRACDQAKEDQKWIRQLAKGIVSRHPDRAVGWCVSWVEVAS